MKRFFDFLFSLLALIILSPVILILSLLVLISSGSPVIFRQERVGYGNRLFTIYKFRTMKDGMRQTKTEDLTEEEIENDITFIGKILRKLSLDELPQLYNILKGDMSFVGFRPPLTYHPWPWEDYTQQQKKMFELRPGITGWAQVNGRRTVEWHKRIEMNVWYAEHISFWLDCRIIFMSFFRVLGNRDNENTGTSVSGKAGDG